MGYRHCRRPLEFRDLQWWLLVLVGWLVVGWWVGECVVGGSGWRVGGVWHVAVGAGGGDGWWCAVCGGGGVVVVAVVVVVVGC